MDSFTPATNQSDNPNSFPGNTLGTELPSEAERLQNLRAELEQKLQDPSTSPEELIIISRQLEQMDVKQGPTEADKPVITSEVLRQEDLSPAQRRAYTQLKRQRRARGY